MNKLEYLNQLETILKKQHLDKADIDDIIRDYAEFFEEGRRQGESDQEIAAKLGSPELIAQQIMEENGYKVAITPAVPKTEFEFKLPKFKMPKFGFGNKEEASEDGNSAEEKREKKIYNKPESKKSALGCLGSGLLLLMKFFVLLVVGGTLAVVFGLAAVGVGCAFIGLLCGFGAVILCFFAASMAAHFMTLPVTVFAIALCIALLALIICLGALMLMLMGWCGKVFLQILRYILDWPHKPVIVTVPQAEMPIMCEEEVVSQEEEGELYE